MRIGVGYGFASLTLSILPFCDEIGDLTLKVKVKVKVLYSLDAYCHGL